MSSGANLSASGDKNVDCLVLKHVRVTLTKPEPNTSMLINCKATLSSRFPLGLPHSTKPTPIDRVSHAVLACYFVALSYVGLAPHCSFDLGDTTHAIGAAPHADSKAFKKRCRRGRTEGKESARVFASCLFCVVVFCLAFAKTMVIGGWSWRDLYQYHGTQPYDVVLDCRAANSGPGVPCGSPWSSLCFDRNR